MAPPARKKRKTEQVDELTFDPEARQEYLTGFHKRKVQRTKHAQELAQKREREEKIRDRKELREQRKKDLENHVAEVNALMKAQRDSDSEDGEDNADSNAEEDEAEEWQGFDEALPINGTDEYIDEGKYTTVTVKELDDIRDFESGSEEDEVSAAPKQGEDAAGEQKKVWSKKRPSTNKPKKKKKQFRYESKLERQTDRRKQKAKSSAAAKARRSA